MLHYGYRVAICSSMNGLLKSKVGRTFLAVFLLLTTPLLVASWFELHASTHALQQQTHSVLRAASDGGEAQLREFLQLVERSTEALANDDSIVRTFSDRNPSLVDNALSRIRVILPEIQEIFCIDATGKVIASTTQTFRGRDESGADLFRIGRTSFYPGDVIREPETGHVVWRMSAPVRNPKTDEPVGVVVMAVDPNSLSSLCTGLRVTTQGADTQVFRIGETGETYIVDKDGYMITESRFIPDAILKVKVDTEPIRLAATQDREMIGDYKDYRGIPVSGSSNLIRRMHWVLLTEINFSQVFAPMAAIRNALLGITILVGIISIVIAAWLAGQIVRPIQLVTDADRELASGNERAAITTEQHLPRNEMGEFVRQRNRRIKELIIRQHQLEHEQKARAETIAELDHISYSMVHEMRAPLRAMTGFAELIETDGGQLNEAQLHHLHKIQAAAERMDHLVCDILRYNSLLRDDLPLGRVKIPELLRNVMEKHEQLRRRKDCINIPAAMPDVLGNSDALAECFTALLVNAFQYCKPNVRPEVNIWSETLRDHIRIVVQDNGVGMSRELQQKAFEIFHRGTHSTHSTGIGLAIVRVTIQRMGGRVGVSSEEGKGSRFWIELKPAV
jgi:signal transduction histidine kinase